MAQFIFNNSTTIIEISPFFTNYEKYLSISKVSKGLKPISEKANISIEKIKKL